MRASIMPLALLAIAFAEWLYRVLDKRPLPRFELGFAVVAIAVGAATPAFELRRTLVNGPSPAPQCSLVGVWDKQTGLIAPYVAYLASTDSLPTVLKDIPVIAGTHDPARCWNRNWVAVAKPE